MKNKNILLLGSTGMAGHTLYYHLENANKYNIVDVSYRNKLTESIIIDVQDKNDLQQLILDLKPNYIINCIGILIKGSADTENAVYINAYLPHFLRKVADKINAKLIHLSTDCVFSGKDGNYKEDSFRDADDVYGRSKALGEIKGLNHLTIRTSIVGPELKSNGEGLFHWFMSQHGNITGYSNAYWGGVTTLELAKAIEYYLENDDISGIVHLTNGEQISKYELLKLIQLIWSANDKIIIEGNGSKNINKSLSKSEIFKYDVPSYETMLKEQFMWMEKNKSLYSFYGF